ncbi:MAG: hypothetical protein ACLT32_14220 [Ruminococcus bicirculans (ex Wegman et al. 2014)]
MKVLSLFDGISCGMLALQRAGIPVGAVMRLRSTSMPSKSQSAISP